jgi:hypothetical protein
MACLASEFKVYFMIEENVLCSGDKAMILRLLRFHRPYWTPIKQYNKRMSGNFTVQKTKKLFFYK